VGWPHALGPRLAQWPCQASWVAVRMGHVATFSPLASWELEIPFLFCFGLNSNLNLKNSYLSDQSSKNHETILLAS
jgi:hypothetical protein